MKGLIWTTQEKKKFEEHLLGLIYRLDRTEKSQDWEKIFLSRDTLPKIVSHQFTTSSQPNKDLLWST